MLGICISSDFWWFFLETNRPACWAHLLPTFNSLEDWQPGHDWSCTESMANVGWPFQKNTDMFKHDISSTLTILYIVLNQSCRAVINWQIIETTLIYFDLSCVFFPNILGVSFPTTSGHDMPWSRAPWNTSRARTSFAETMEKTLLIQFLRLLPQYLFKQKNPRPRDFYMFLFFIFTNRVEEEFLFWWIAILGFLVHRNPESVCSYLNLTSKSK